MHGEGTVGFVAVDDFSLQTLKQGEEANCDLLPLPTTTTATAITQACRAGDLKCEVRRSWKKIIKLIIPKHFIEGRLLCGR